MTAQRFMTAIMLLLSLTAGCRAPDSFSHWTRTQSVMRTEESAASLKAPETTGAAAMTFVGYRRNDAVATAPAASETVSSENAAGEQLVNPSESVDPPVAASLRLSLEEAIGLSLQRNPDLVAARASEPVARAALRVAKTYPYNPQFQTQVLPYYSVRDAENSATAQQHVVVQTFEWGGQQRHREGAAMATLAQVNRTILQAELLNIAQTTRLFFAAAYQQELLELSRTLADLNDDLVGVIERRANAGQANNADVALARLQAQATRRQRRLAEANYRTAMLTLRTQMNLGQEVSLDLVAGWTQTRWQSFDAALGPGPREGYIEDDVSGLVAQDADWDDRMLRQIVAHRPDVMAARSAAATASENLRLANAMRCPNLQTGPLYQLDPSSALFWGIQAQIDIPVVNTGRPLVQQRSAELRLQQITAQQLENRAVLEANAALQRYERARRLVEQSRDEVAGEIAESLKPFADQFKAGQITLLQVFAARATLAQSRQSYFDLLNELSLAVADLTQATGLPPQSFIEDFAEPPAMPNSETSTASDSKIECLTLAETMESEPHSTEAKAAREPESLAELPQR